MRNATDLSPHDRRPTIGDCPTEALIGAEWRTLSSTFPVTNPATGEEVARVADCGPAEAREAADHAVAAFASWKQETAYHRSAILRRWNDLILARQNELARIMSLEMGKPIAEARGEVRYTAGFVEFYAEEAKRVYGETIPSQFGHKRLLAIRQPVGPAYAITPWNFPAAMVTRKAAPALAAACSLILKPAEQSPLSALFLARLWLEAGGPPGTLQILPSLDPIPVSKVLIDDPRIRKLTFTGSTAVGIKLYTQAGPTMKRLSLELGGHSPFLIFEDADLELAVKEVVASKFRNAGQTCVCTNRIYVHDAIHDRFVDRLAQATKSLRVGDPLEESTQIGPLVDRDVFEKVSGHVNDAVAKGARVVTGGSPGERTYFQPTVLSDVSAGMRILEEETFGPVAPVLRFREEAEAVRLANATPVGLAAYLWTRDLSRAFRVAEALEFGIVGVNDGVPSTPQAPFGGVKNSGIGREGGHWGIDEFLDVKYISMAL
jgi:succinate-semialdehyde dehydrogenase/glutarate-semialdehyde dehydrogenase